MPMYNKIFTKILDSSIWLESTETRLIWLTFIAVMDEDGFAQFASVKNLAHRARVLTEQAEEAVKALEGPDPDSSDPENEGRRIERVPGGWMVLNAPKYRDLVTRVVIKEQTRRRVAKHRASKCNAGVTTSNENVTPSEAEAEAEAEAKEVKKRALLASEGAIFPDDFPETHKPPLALWWEHKREKGQSYKPTGWKTLCAQQARKSADEIRRDVESSIANNYAGIYADKQSAFAQKAQQAIRARV